jgi:hypothetical protein
VGRIDLSNIPKLLNAPRSLRKGALAMVTLVNLAGASDPPICAPNRHPCSDSQSKPRVQPRTHRFLQMSKKRDLAQTAQNQPTQFRPKNRRGNGLKNEAVWWAEKLSSPGAKKAAVRSRGWIETAAMEHRQAF